jgi:hypothetical protein
MTTAPDTETVEQRGMRMINDSIAYVRAMTLDPQPMPLVDRMYAGELTFRERWVPKIPDSPWVDRIGWFGIAFVALALLPTWPLAALGVVLVAVSVRQARRIAYRRAERLRLIADCDLQHAILMAGSNDEFGLMGRFQTSGTLTDDQVACMKLAHEAVAA